MAEEEFCVSVDRWSILEGPILRDNRFELQEDSALASLQVGSKRVCPGEIEAARRLRVLSHLSQYPGFFLGAGTFLQGPGDFIPKFSISGRADDQEMVRR